MPAAIRRPPRNVLCADDRSAPLLRLVFCVALLLFALPACTDGENTGKRPDAASTDSRGTAAATPADRRGAHVNGDAAAEARTGTGLPVAIQTGFSGLEALRVDGRDIVSDGRPMVKEVVFETQKVNEKGVLEYHFRRGEVNNPEMSLGAAERGGGDELEYRYPWGAAFFAWRAEAHRAVLDLTLVNQTDQTLADFRVRLASLRFPEPPEGMAPEKPRMERSFDNLAVVEAKWPDAKLLACVDTIWPPLHFGFGEATDDAGRVRPLVVQGGIPAPAPEADTVHPHGLPRIPPGGHATYRFSLRFATPDADRHEILADLYEEFRAYWRPIGDWPDNRFIGAVFLPSAGHLKSERNPRGWKWFNKRQYPDFDIRTEAGRKLFEEKVVEYAERSVEVLTAMDAQGVIVWNLEGEENPHPISYIGDPRMLPILTPEMDEVADRFFRVFTEAGLRTGVTIRPTQVYRKKDGAVSHGTGSHGPDRNPLDDDFGPVEPAGLPWWRHYPVAERMIRKIDYAKKRWGCTIFYVDTNGVIRPMGEESDFQWVELSGHTWRRIKEAHPDVLLIPELRREQWTFHAAQWAYTAPYDQLDYTGRVATPEYVRRLFPDARICNYVANTDPWKLEDLHEECVDAVRAGDILMGRGWFFDAQDREIKVIYDDARRPRPRKPKK